jgi:hypothetical protein
MTVVAADSRPGEIIAYQLEAADVLDAYFNRRVAGPAMNQLDVLRAALALRAQSAAASFRRCRSMSSGLVVAGQTASFSGDFAQRWPRLVQPSDSRTAESAVTLGHLWRNHTRRCVGV